MHHLSHFVTLDRRIGTPNYEYLAEILIVILLATGNPQILPTYTQG